MIRALVVGTLYADPQRRTSQAGKAFTTAKVRADGKDGATVWVSLLAFGEWGERLATMKTNNALAVAGRLETSAYLDKAGTPAAGLSLIVDELATLRGNPKPPQPQPQRQPFRSTRPPRTEPAGAGLPFDDLDDWQP